MPDRDGGRHQSAEILFEIRQIGLQVRIAAIDPRTGTEVVVFGPAAAGREGLQAMAARKLALRLQRQKGHGNLEGRLED